MRRAPFLTLAFGLSLAASAAGQTPRVGLVVGLAPPAEPSGARRARVQVKDLLVDQRWLGALDQAFPIRLSFEMEIWRSRQVGPDDYQRTAQWSILIQRDLLEDQYLVTRILNSGPEQFRFANRDSLARWIGGINEVDALPQGNGTFYYNFKLKIATLSDQEMEDLERFLRGETKTPPQQERSSLMRTLRRFIARLGGGLPLEELEKRTDQFAVRRARD